MGVHSTLEVSREAALKKIRSMDWESLSNEQLSDTLDVLLYGTLYNFVVERHGNEDDAFLERLKLDP